MHGSSAEESPWRVLWLIFMIVVVPIAMVYLIVVLAGASRLRNDKLLSPVLVGAGVTGWLLLLFITPGGFGGVLIPPLIFTSGVGSRLTILAILGTGVMAIRRGPEAGRGWPFAMICGALLLYVVGAQISQFDAWWPRLATHIPNAIGYPVLLGLVAAIATLIRSERRTGASVGPVPPLPGPPTRGATSDNRTVPTRPS